MRLRTKVLLLLLAACVVAGCDEGSGAGGEGGAAASGGAAGSGGGAGGASGTSGAAASAGSGGAGSGATGGAAGAGGVGGGTCASAGAGGSGGCTDAICGRPTLTAQPSIDNAVASPGSAIMLQLPVSAQTTLIRARAIVGSTAVGEAEVVTTGSDVVSLMLPLDENPSVLLPSEAYIGITLCEQETNCLSGANRTFVSYVSIDPSETLYFKNVFDDGVLNQDVAGSSCYEVLLFTLEEP